MATNPFDQFDPPAATTSNPFDQFDKEPPEPSGALRRLGDLGIAAVQGAIAVPEAAVGLANLVTGGKAGKLAEQAGFRPKEAKEILAEYSSPELKAAKQNFQQADGVLAKTGVAITNPSLIADAVVQSLPATLGGGVAARGILAAAPKLGAVGAGAVGEGLVGAGASAEAIRQESADGELSAKQSLLAAGSGLATGAFGALGGAAARKLGIGDVDTALATGTLQPGAAAANKGIARRAAEGFLSEGFLEELPQSLSEQAIQNYALDRPLTEGLADAGVLGVLSGGALGAGAAAISGRPAAPVAPPAPVVDPNAGPISRAASLALPAPVVSVDGQANAATADQRNFARQYVQDVQDVPFRDVTPVPGSPVSNAAALLASNVPQAPANTALQAINTVAEEPAPPRALSLEEADARDQAAYDEFFANTDAPEFRAELAPADLLDDNIPWDEPSSADTRTFLTALGATDQEIEDAIAQESSRAQASNTGAAGGQTNDAGAPGPVAGPAQEPAGQVGAPNVSPAPAIGPLAGNADAGRTDNGGAGLGAGERNGPDALAPVAAGNAAAGSGGAAVPPAAPGDAPAVSATPIKIGERITTTVDGRQVSGVVEKKPFGKFRVMLDGETAARVLPADAVARAESQPNATGTSADAAPIAIENVATQTPIVPAGAPSIAPISTPETPPAAAPAAPVNEYAKSWFGSTEKAEAFLQKKGAADRYEVVKTGPTRFEVKPKEQLNVPQADEAQQTEAQRQEVAAAGNGAIQAEQSPVPAAPGADGTQTAGVGQSQQFDSYRRYIEQNDKIGRGTIEQIQADTRLNDGEAEQLAAMAEAKVTPATGSQAAGKPVTPQVPTDVAKRAAPRAMNSEGRAVDGKPINGGDAFSTASGRATTPYPKQKSERYATQWLIDNAVAEAESRGDDFNARSFKAEKPGKNGSLPPASIASMQEYLFGEQPAVVPSTLKPLNAKPGDQLPNATAPEQVVGVDDRELAEIVAEFNKSQQAMIEDGEKISHVFDAPKPKEVVRLQDKVRVYQQDKGWMTVAEAKAAIAEWKANARNQGETRANSQRIVLSLFDLTGQWSKPWEEAGYQVYRFDIQDDPDFGDVNKFDTEFFNDNFGSFDGQDVYAILAACPCTDFASSGARHFAAKDADGRTVASVKLVHQALATIEYFKPSVWAVENPVGRIEKLGGLPPWRLSFDPNHLGDPYTKKTILWGRFNADLPIAPVDPVEGSKMWAKYGGKSLATKNARSETPEGFAYGFFQANNAMDNMAMGLANKYDRLDRKLFEQAVAAGVSEQAITDAVDDPYYIDLDDEAAEQAIRDLIDDQDDAPPTPPPAGERTEPNLKAAIALLAEQKAATGNAVAEGKVRKQARELAAITPASDEKTVLALDMIATRLGMGEGKLKGLEFAPAAVDDVSQSPPPAAPKSEKKPRANPKAAAEAEQRADYFTPGNIVNGYGGLDEVLSYKATPTGDFSVTVQRVIKIDGEWVREGRPDNARTHSTRPDARELKNGPVDRLPFTPSSQVKYTDKRADGKPFPDVPNRGVATSAAPSVSANTVFTDDAAEKARAILKAKLGQLSSGIDPEILQAGITLAGYHIEKGARTFAAYAKAMVNDLGDGVKPYLKSWYMGVKYDPRATVFEGMDSAATVESADLEAIGAESAPAPAAPIGALDLFTPKGKFKIAQRLSEFFIGGGEFKSIVDARKKIAELTGNPVTPGTEAAKQADEAIETAVVLAGREIVRAGREKGVSSQSIYGNLLDLYNRQPNLAVRSSTSVRDQAYSTPVPLAFVASELAGVTGDSKLIESTAGNGMLAIGATLENATVNELNPKRAAMLDAIGFKATTKNAATETVAPAKSQDAVVINPPFGVTKDDKGDTIIYTAKEGFDTREVDHAIVFKTLEAMKDDGRAVLIVGGVQAEGEEGRRADYRGKSKRTFYFNLYNDYNVVDHFAIDGSMYSKQGASYPVDVIVISGRGKAQRALPAAELPQVIGSYDQLKEKLNDNSIVGTRGSVGTAGVAGGQNSAGASDPTPVAGGSVRTGAGNGQQGQRGAATGGANVQPDGPAGAGQSQPGGDRAGAGQPRTANAPQLGDGQQPIPGDGQQQPAGAAGNRGNQPSGVGGPSVVSGERVESGLTDRRGQEQETETQVAYAPFSGTSSVGTLVPRAMADSIKNSLQSLSDEVGSIDEYVANGLGLDTDQLAGYFSAEQVDALALSIKNAEEGKGFIIGDQTGIGKGRVVAAMIRYAITQGKVPIFVTEKPNLYSDMIRDLDDIGMTEALALDSKKPRVFITNGTDAIPYTLLRTVDGEVVENNLTLRAPKSGKALDDVMREMAQSESLGDYKVIFTTYSQLQTVKGKMTERQRFIQQFGNSNYMIFDESHNAGGAGETQARTKDQREAAADGQSLVTGRAAFVRSLVGNAFGTFFSSATYAKRPDVMDLYSSTNMKLAVDKISELGAAIKNGGVPMQQAVANMLTKDGQYIRRERTFAGVSYDTVETKVDKQTAENMASAMREILKFSRAKEVVIKAIQKEMDKQGSMVKAMGGESSSIQGANFGSIMHNLIDQMLLSLKVQASVDHAITRLKAGEKVVMTVSNTMGSFLQSYAEEMGINAGDAVALSFSDLYQRYLEKQRMVTIKDGAGNKVQQRLTDQELGPALVAMYNRIGEQIGSSGFGSAPISPIDHLHAQLRKAGYKTDEITGRTIALNYDSGAPVLASRTANIKQRVNAVRSFNNGETDVLILNQAGSTGLSLHASSKFKDQRKRHMVIVQAEKNIDTHMQMLGRVHRTGQIIPPSYSQMSADIPAEMRPAAVLMKKMASLNANTTASRKSAVTAEGAVDFINQYGGQVAHEYLRDNPDVLESIGGNKVITLVDDVEDATEDDIRKFTGYIPVLPIAKQEEIYKDLIDRYNELIERENTLGTNKLEAKALDLDAETVSSQAITEPKDDKSIFAAQASMERIDVKRTVKPYSSREVADMAKESLGGATALERTREQVSSLKTRMGEFMEKRRAALLAAEADEVRVARETEQIALQATIVQTVLANYKIGESVSIKDKQGQILYGVVTNVSNAGRTANPAAGSDWKMQIALANGDSKTLNLSFNQVGSKYEMARAYTATWYNSETQQFENMPVTDIFDKGTTARREKRWMVTGNILAGFAKYPGQIVTYTKKDGTVGQGVLMNRQFDFEKEKAAAPLTMKSASMAMQFFEKFGNNSAIGTEDGTLSIRFMGNRYMVNVPSSKKEGGTYFLDQRLTDAMGVDFYKRGGLMSAAVYERENIKSAAEYLITGREEKLVAITNVEAAKKAFGPKPADGETVNFSRKPPVSGPKGLRATQTQGAVDAITKAWANGPEIVVVRDMQDPDVPEAVRKYDAKQRSLGADGTPEGFYFKGKVYVVASMMRNANDVARVVFHEALGHFGLQNAFGSALKPILKQVATMRAAEVKAKAESYGLDVKVERQMLLAAEEVLAEMAQSRPEIGFVRRAIAAIRTWLRANVPSFNSLRMSDDELVRNFILPAREFVERGRKADLDQLADNLVPAFSREVAKTDTPEFRRWYSGQNAADQNARRNDSGGTSGVSAPAAAGPQRNGPLDDKGRPVVFYHGTRDDVGAFDLNHPNRKDTGWLGRGVYGTSDPESASTYAGMKRGSGGPRVMPLYFAVTNPYQIDLETKRKLSKAPQGYIDKFTEKVKARGHDGVMLKFSDGTTEIVAFEPSQVKSAIGNNGDFDPDNADILFSRATGAKDVDALKAKATDALNDLFNVPGKLNWWQKTVGTMYDLSERNPAFKRVFDAGQAFINDVSAYATQSANLAPRILPKLETWRDIGKSPLSAADTKAIAAPIFEGTLLWTRDESGKLIRFDELQARYALMTDDQKAQVLLRLGKVTEGELKRWQATPLPIYEGAVRNRFDREFGQPGVAFNDAELRSQFKLSDEQISLYREFRAATDKSLNDLAVSDMVRYGGKDVEGVRADVQGMDADAAGLVLRDHLIELSKEQPDRANVLLDTANKMIEKADRVADLVDRGYAPLTRFGQYTLDVVDENGERVYFGLFESRMEAGAMARKMKTNFPGAQITQGTMSDQSYKLFAGVSPETLELFGEMLGLEGTGSDPQSQAFQQYLKLAKSNRSALKRLIERKGIAGFSEDAGRVLAGFVYSNARQTASNLHLGEMTEAANAIPQQQGEMKDVAIKLADYIKNPQEEAQAVRGLLFAQYLGGSIASAMVNLTQPIAVTTPYLSQFGGAAKAGRRVAAALKDALKPTTGDKALDAALAKAEAEGIVAPQEVHQLLGQAQGRGSLKSGDGTRAGDAAAKASNALSKLSLAWGKLFGVAEQYNRRSTFIAAYRTAVEEKLGDPAAFAERAIAQTQFVYNKGNRPQWARGAIGATLFTFKQYSISYMELLTRMANAGEPGSPERAAGRKAALLAVGLLFLMGGAGGLPFAEDAEDVVDGVLQRLGYNFSTKRAKKEFLTNVFGQGGAHFIENGISGLPGVPIDVSGRLGLGNLIPGTGLFTTKSDYTRDVTELAGPAGDLAKRAFQGVSKLASGEVLGTTGALATVAPVAATNLYKGYEMYSTGIYKDSKGKKVLDVDAFDALAKSIGFQPADVARVQQATGIKQNLIAQNKLQEGKIADMWAQGVSEKDPAKVQRAREKLAEWNANNPETPIRILMPQIVKRVRALNEDKATRIAKTAPTEIRASVRRELAEELGR